MIRFFDRKRFAPAWCDENAKLSASTSCERRIEIKLNRLRERYQSADLFILSFPKSGRTWIRAVVSGYLQKRYRQDVDLEFSVASHFFSRPCFTHNFFDVYRYVERPVELLEKQFLVEKPLVIVVRDPRDVCASYFHHIGSRDRMWTGSILRFALDPVYGIGRQLTFVNMILDLYAAHSGPKLALSYETLRDNPAAGFAELLSLIDQKEVDLKVLDEAITDASFERMREAEISVSEKGRVEKGARLGVKDWSGDTNALKVRRGVVGGFWQDFGLAGGILVSALPSVLGLVSRLRWLREEVVQVSPPARCTGGAAHEECGRANG